MRIRALITAFPLAMILSGCPVWDEDTTDPMLCVGLGCACFDDFDCASPYECVSGRCDLPPDGCLTDRDCEDGATCEAGVCVTTPTENCRTHGDCPVGEYCAPDGECTPSSMCDPDMACDGGFECDYRATCVPESPHCLTDAECTTEGELCVEGLCRSNTETCQFNYECGPGAACVNGGCTPICGGDADCGSGSTCQGGFCKPNPGECVTSTSCPSGEHCVDGRCLPDCRDTGTCSSGDYCAEDDFCRPAWQRDPFCRTSDDCAPGSICVDGACRTPCPSMTATECMMTDVNLTVCAGDELCYTSNEFDPECADRSGCTGDDDCIDGICR